jgi:type II secretory pathway component PulK
VVSIRGWRDCGGFALPLVLWTLAMLSVIALSLASTVGTEVRASQNSWDELQAERLARSGHEISTYLESRALGTPGEDLAGLPVTSLIPRLTYRVTVDAGTVDLMLEGENGRFDLTSSSEETTTAFLTGWTGQPSRSRDIAAAIADWVDANDDVRPFGAEAASYLSRGYRPRNSPLGMADPFLINGLERADFAEAITGDGASTIRSSLVDMIAVVPAGNKVNPNYAAKPVLELLPGMTSQLLSSILEMRQHAIFSSVQDFIGRTGTANDSAVLTQLTFDRGVAPAILSIAHVRDSAQTRRERRVGRMQSPNQFLVLVERDVP